MPCHWWGWQYSWMFMKILFRGLPLDHEEPNPFRWRNFIESIKLEDKKKKKKRKLFTSLLCIITQTHTHICIYSRYIIRLSNNDHHHHHHRMKNISICNHLMFAAMLCLKWSWSPLITLTSLRIKSTSFPPPFVHWF